MHAGSKENAVFLVKWKYGDRTWLPYYQITHLIALTEYFELQGIHSIEKLWEGMGQPPREDLQNYIGAVHLFQGCNYKNTPPQVHHPSFVKTPNPKSHPHHVSAHQQLPSHIK